MSLLNGKLPRRMAVALGSACFLGGLTLAAAPADAGLYVSIRVNPASLPAGVTQSGNVFTGYTITAPSGVTTPLSLQIVAAITSGASTSAAAANPALQTIRGAIRTVASTNGSFTATSGVSFVSGNGSQTFQNTSPLPGSFGAGGIGPQSGTFGSSDSTSSSDRNRFESIFVSNNSTTVGTVAVPGAFNIGTAETVVGGFTGSVSGTGSLQLQAIAGGTDIASALAQYYENRDPANLSGSVLFTGITSNAATINFGTVAPAVTRGDWGGGGEFGFSPNNAVDFADIEPFLLYLNDPASYLALNPGFNVSTAIARGDFGGGGDFGFNPNGALDFADIEPFLLFLNDPAAYASLQPGGSSVSGGLSAVGAVPEPSSLAFVLPAAAMLRRRRVSR